MPELSRRTFIARAGAGAAIGAVPLAVPTLAAAKPATGGRPVSSKSIVDLFAKLPGTVGLKIQAPPAAGDRGLLIESNASQQMFVGSAIKTFALCESVRQSDSPDVTARIAARQLALNERVWNTDSQSFNPPYLMGKVSQRTALEAMICHSDNTATGMTFKDAGVSNIRKLVPVQLAVVDERRRQQRRHRLCRRRDHEMGGLVHRLAALGVPHPQGSGVQHAIGADDRERCADQTHAPEVASDGGIERGQLIDGMAARAEVAARAGIPVASPAAPSPLSIVRRDIAAPSIIGATLSRTVQAANGPESRARRDLGPLFTAACGAQLAIENDVLATIPATRTYWGHSTPGLQYGRWISNTRAV